MQKTGVKEERTTWHEQPSEIILTDLKATITGLSENEALERLQIYGPNRLPSPPRKNAFFRFLLQFHNLLIYVLLGSAVITAMLDHWIDTFVILAVVVVNAIIGFIQEGKAEKAIEALRLMLSPSASVLRDGERHSVEGESLVPGDIVLLEAGDKVPADLRLLQAHGLSIKEAILTGESIPVEKHKNPVASDAALGDRSCLAFSGTLVTNGQGRGVVVATGAKTEIGRVGGLLSKVETLTTPLVEQMDLFSKWLTVMVLLVAAVLLTFGYFVEFYTFTDVFMAVVAISVAAIPEGLPAVLTITLAVGVQEMAKRNAIIRRLPAIETLGSVSVICTDKTGTLTRNEMTVASVVTPRNVFTVEGMDYAPVGEVKLQDRSVNGENQPALTEIGLAAALCNDSSLREQDGAWDVKGDPMEGALLSFAGKVGVAFREQRKTWTRTDTIAFDFQHRFMAALHHNHEQHAQIFVKGAPEQILSMCNVQRSENGSTEPLDKDDWREKIEGIAAQGQRVLALAVREVKPEHTVLEHTDVKGALTFLGVVGLFDPPSVQALAAVAECQGAGISVKMITGDHVGTAIAIGRLFGLQNPDKVLTGADLDTMDDVALKAAVFETNIFARTSPEHKLRLVIALQSRGMTVAMTGDGVNDAPALKRADVGIAMGKKGSEVAKEAGEVVLADDNFASIAAAVREGRTVYDNIKKAISWTLPTNMGEAMTILVALLFHMTLPITPIQILWVNLITGVSLGLVFAFEPPEENVMRRPPHPRHEPLLTRELAWHCAIVSFLILSSVFGIYFYAVDRGYSVELGRTLAVNMLVVLEIFHLFFIRNLHGSSMSWKTLLGTKVVWLSVGTVTIAQFAITYLSPLQKIFHTEAMSLLDNLLILGIGVVFFVVTEIEKQLRLRMQAVVEE